MSEWLLRIAYAAAGLAALAAAIALAYALSAWLHDLREHGGVGHGPGGLGVAAAAGCLALSVGASLALRRLGRPR